MKFIDIEKEIRRIISNKDNATVTAKYFVMANKYNVLTNLCGDSTMLHSSKEIVKQLFDIVENHDIITSIVGMVIGALMYVISPIDLVPDFISVVGLLDDACIVKTIMHEIDDMCIVKRIMHEIVKNKTM